MELNQIDLRKKKELTRIERIINYQLWDFNITQQINVIETIIHNHKDEIQQLLNDKDDPEVINLFLENLIIYRRIVQMFNSNSLDPALEHLGKMAKCLNIQNYPFWAMYALENSLKYFAEKILFALYEADLLNEEIL